jgi:cbb3-type cytochrome oxidase subunit 3
MSRKPDRRNVEIVSLFLIAAIAIAYRRRAARRRDEALDLWIAEQMLLLAEQQAEQAETADELAAKVIYLAEHRSKKG